MAQREFGCINRIVRYFLFQILDERGFEHQKVSVFSVVFFLGT